EGIHAGWSLSAASWGRRSLRRKPFFYRLSPALPFNRAAAHSHFFHCFGRPAVPFCAFIRFFPAARLYITWTAFVYPVTGPPGRLACAGAFARKSLCPFLPCFWAWWALRLGRRFLPRIKRDAIWI